MSDRLSKAAAFYFREAHKRTRSRAHLGATVMYMAALEAILLALCFLYPEDLKKTVTYQRKRFRRKRNKALDFSLKQLIDVAREASWFPNKRIIWGGRRADLAGFTHEIRMYRNLVHPGEVARSNAGMMKFTKSVNAAVAEVYDVAVSWLINRVHESLRKRMERDERRANYMKLGG